VSLNAQAATAVWRNSLDVADKWHLFRMIGLVDEVGNLLPDDTREYELSVIETMSSGAGRFEGLEPKITDKPKVSSAPAALRVLPPIVVPPKPVAKPKPKPKAKAKAAPKTASAPRRTVPCGAPSGYKRHRRENTPVCDQCRDARRAYERDLAAKQRAANPKPHKERAHGDCGTLAGARYHRRHKQPVCPPCNQAENTYQRTRYHAIKAEQVAQ
jgi:hypothetical protein